MVPDPNQYPDNERKINEEPQNENDLEEARQRERNLRNEHFRRHLQTGAAYTEVLDATTNVLTRTLEEAKTRPLTEAKLQK
ncbi:unnamed protein product [Caenorhabditis bovis]|uniref:Uncharacterized protein n=1 Tax=Caenorhabditis bovis TaxID=2654633 RepID=A0A8S1EPF5_9PELO|nr:unnamed protein product [Caenorhabditis bovis]